MEREAKKRKMQKPIVEMTFHRETVGALTREVPSPPDLATMEMGSHPYGVTSYTGYSPYSGAGYGAKRVHWANPTMGNYYGSGDTTTAWGETGEDENDTSPTDWEEIARDLGLDDWQTEGDSFEDDPYEMYTIYHHGSVLFRTYCRQSELMDKVSELITSYCTFNKIPLIPIERLDVREEIVEMQPLEAKGVFIPFISPFESFEDRPQAIAILEIHGFDLNKSKTTNQTIKLPVYNRMPVYQMLMDARAEVTKVHYQSENKRVSYDFLARFGIYADPGDFFVFYQNKISIWGESYENKMIRKKVDDLQGLFYYYKLEDDPWADSPYKTWERCLCCTRPFVVQRDDVWFCYYCARTNTSDDYCAKCRSANERSWDKSLGPDSDCVTVCPVRIREQSSGEESRLVSLLFRGITAKQIKDRLRDSLNKRLQTRYLEVANSCLVTNSMSLVPDTAVITKIVIGEPVGKLVSATFKNSGLTLEFTTLSFRFTVTPMQANEEEDRMTRYWNLLRRVEKEKERTALVSVDILCCQQPDGLAFNVPLRVPADTQHHVLMAKAEEKVKERLDSEGYVLESGSITFQWDNKDRPLNEQKFNFGFRAEQILSVPIPVTVEDLPQEVAPSGSLIVQCVQTPATQAFSVQVDLTQGMTWREVDNAVSQEVNSYLMKKGHVLGIGNLNSYGSEHGDVSLVRIVNGTVLMSRRVDRLPTKPTLTYTFTVRRGVFAAEA